MQSSCWAEKNLSFFWLLFYSQTECPQNRESSIRGQNHHSEAFNLAIVLCRWLVTVYKHYMPSMNKHISAILVLCLACVCVVACCLYDDFTLSIVIFLGLLVSVSFAFLFAACLPCLCFCWPAAGFLLRFAFLSVLPRVLFVFSLVCLASVF